MNYVNDERSTFDWCREVLEKYPFTREEIDQRRREMSDEFQQPIGKMDYRSDLTHCAYIKADVTFHASVISDLIGRWCLEKLDQPVIIASIGCGPGTDAIGVLRHVMKNVDEPQKRPKFMFYLYDSIPSWSTAIHRFFDVIRQPQPQLDDSLQIMPPPEFQYLFQPWDLTRDANSFNGIHNFQAVDIFIFSMVFGGIFNGGASTGEIQNVLTNLKMLCGQAKIGSYFLFVDTQRFPLGLFLQVTALAGESFRRIEPLDGQSETRIFQLEPREEKRDLGNYFSDGVNGFSPKLNQALKVHLHKKIK